MKVMADQAGDDIERFRRVVRDRLGLDFDDGKGGPLVDVLGHRLRDTGLGAERYLAALEDREAGSRELRILARDLTVTETSFFRNPDQIDAFTNVALPDRIRARAAVRRLSILSAGCASGEEAYTLAACINDCVGLKGWDVTILGVDVNTTALKKAAAARYSRWSLRQTPASLRSRHFQASGREFLLDGAVRDKVSFEERNLVVEDPSFWQPGRFDIIFCRNVLMYFTPEVARAVVGRLAASLGPGGFLFLGHAETLRGLSSDFDLRQSHGTFFYQRTNALRKGPTQVHPAPPRRTPAAAKTAASRDGDWYAAIHGASQRVRALTTAAAPQAPPRAIPTGGATDLRLIVDHLEREQYAAARNLLGTLPPERRQEADALLLSAILETHGGDLATAEGACDLLLERDEMNAGAHYLKALCRESADDGDRAIHHHRTSACLDSGFALPRLHLGRLLRRAGDRDAALGELRRALVLLLQQDCAYVRLFGGGFSRAALTALCRAEISACTGAR